jgi:sec-independent protein translocase protein TatA
MAPAFSTTLVVTGFHFRFKELSMFEGLFQPMHLLVIFGIALLVFGPKKLPELGKGIGEGIRGFKSAMNTKELPEEKPTTIAAQDQGPTKG